MTVDRTFDYELARSIITDPYIYDHVSDDNSPSAKEFQPVQSELMWYLIVRDEEEVLGCFLFVPQNSVCFEVHTCILPNALGSRAREAAQMAKEWMFTHSPAERIVTNVPETNILALKFAKAAGLKEYGLNPRSFLKHGLLLDQTMLGVSKCQQQ